MSMRPPQQGQSRTGAAAAGLAVFFYCFGCRCVHGEQDADRGEIFRAGAAGQKPIMADAMEALGQTCVRKRRMNSPVSSVMVL